MTERLIYFDHAATTPTEARVVEAMEPFFTERFANASTLYRMGRESERAIDEARETVARRINASGDEIYFTSGGTESDNWAIKGAALALEDRGRHIITSAVEHHAVLEACDWLENRGWEVTVLPVSADGLVEAAAVEEAIRDETVLVTIMHANNEIGTIEPLEEIARITRSRDVLFHTDAVQTVGKVPVDVEELGVDLLSAAAHKFYGPKGAGFLYVRKGARIEPLLHGGGHERGRRSGTHNVPGIVGLAKALELSDEAFEANERLDRLARKLWEGISSRAGDLRCNTPFERSLPGYLNFVADGVEGEAMLLRLDAKGVCVSSGSACATGSLDPSHVLLAIGLPPEVAHGSLRFTLGRENTEDEVDFVVEELPAIIATLREMSPTYKAKTA